jgi:hypothetical protein
MTDIAATLAADFIDAQGWACIRIEACDASRRCIVTVDGVDAREESGARLWLARRHADKTLATFFSRHQEARRRPRGAGLIVQAPVTTTERMIRDVAHSLGFSVAGDDFVDEQLALVTRRVETALARMKRDGSLKQLNREYSAAREMARAGGTPSLPGYPDWLAARLRPAFASLAC